MDFPGTRAVRDTVRVAATVVMTEPHVACGVNQPPLELRNDDDRRSDEVVTLVWLLFLGAASFLDFRATSRIAYLELLTGCFCSPDDLSPTI